MHKDMKKYDTPTDKRNFFNEKLDAANVDLDSLLRLAEMVTGLTFHETRPNEYRAQHTGVRVSKPNGHKYGKLHDESMKTNFADPRGYTFKKLFFEYTNGQTHAQKIDLLYRLNVATLQECSQMQGGKAYAPNAQTIEIRAKVNAQPKQKKATNSKTWEYVQTDWNTQHGHNTMQFLHKKTGANMDVLTRYVVPISHKIGTDTDGKEYRFDSTAQNFMYGFIDARGLVRIAQPNQPNAKRLAVTGKSEMVYRYGFDQLPTDGTGLTCVICAGETDTICINAHGNQYGFYAICFNSETKPFDQPTLDELRARGFDLLALYDNDATGRKAVATHAQNAGVAYTDTNLLWTYWNIPNAAKDICDLYAFGGFSTVVRVLEFAKATNGRWERETDNPFSVAIPHGYKLPIYQYLGSNTDEPNGNITINPTKFIELAMCQNSKLSLVSQAGTGKTTMFQTIFGTDKVLQAYGKDFYVLLVPTTQIAKQQYKEFIQVFGVNGVQLIYGEEKDTHALDKGAKIVICVFDSFPSLCGISTGKKKHIADILHRSYVVLDEYHILISAYDYRQKDAFRFIQNKVVESANVPCLTMTGTPVLYANIQRTTDTDGQTTDVHLFKHIFATPKVQNKIKCSIVTHTLKRAAIAGHIEDTAQPTDTHGATFVKWDNIKYIDSICKKFTQRGLVVDNVNASNKIKNQTSREIVEYGKFSKPLDYLFFTKIFEAGVSIKNKCQRVVTVETVDFREIIQIANRPRVQTDGTNSVFDLHILLRAKETDTDNQAQQVLDVLDTIADTQTDALFYAQLCAQKELEYEKGKTGRARVIANKRLSIDEQRFIYIKFDALGNATYHVDTLGILHYVMQLENAGVTPEKLQKRLGMDTRFEFQPMQTITDGLEDVDVKNELQQLKEIEQQHLERFDQLLLDTTTQKAVLECVAHITKNPELKEAIRDVFHLPKWSLDTHSQFLEAETDALRAKGSQYKISKALEFIAAGTTKDKALQTVATETRGTINKNLEQIIIVDKHKREKKRKASLAQGGTGDINGLTGNSIIQDQRINFVCKYGLFKFVENIQLGNTKNEFTAQRVLDTINKALERGNAANGTKHKPFTTEKQALTLIGSFFNMLEPQRAWTRDGKRGKMVHSIDLSNPQKSLK